MEARRHMLGGSGIMRLGGRGISAPIFWAMFGGFWVERSDGANLGKKIPPASDTGGGVILLLSFRGPSVRGLPAICILASSARLRLLRRGFLRRRL